MQRFFGLPVGDGCDLSVIRGLYSRQLIDALKKKDEIGECFCSMGLLDRFDVIHGIISKSLLFDMIDYIQNLIESELLDRDTQSRINIGRIHESLLQKLKMDWGNGENLFKCISERLEHIEKDLLAQEFAQKAGKIAGEYIKYNTHFFKGKFIDRNGKGLEFSSEELKSLASRGKSVYKSVKSGGGISLDESTGQFVSKIICLLFEFVFDEVFKVPFYCKEIANAVNDLAKLEDTDENKNEIKIIEKKIQDIENDIKDLCTPAAPDGLAKEPAICSNLESMNVRQKLLKLQEFDRILFNLNKKKDDLNNMVAQGNVVGGNYGKQVEVFTCCAAGVIVEPIHDIILQCADGTKKDYSALVGELTAYSATKASAYVKSAVGPVIKGAGVFSTNNEALTEIAASTLGIITKKLVEVVVYESLKDIITNDKISKVTHAGKNIPVINHIGGY